MPTKNRIYSLDALRLLFALFVCIVSFGFPRDSSRYIQILSGFSTIGFYIISGFLVLRDDENLEARLVRAIRRTAVTFGCLAAAYLALNVVLAMMLETPVASVFAPLAQFSLWRDFLLLNLWPFTLGGSIWFIQAMLYAWCILWLLKKTGLLKYDIPLTLLLLAFAVYSGEAAHILKYKLFGAAYMSGNFLTRALPYLLVGRLMRRWKAELERLPDYACLLLAATGAAFTLGEVAFLKYMGHLTYTGHMAGNAMLAAGLILLALKHPAGWRLMPLRTDTPARVAKLIYWVHNPLGTLMLTALLMMSFSSFLEMQAIVGLSVYLVLTPLSLLFLLRKEIAQSLKRIKERPNSQPVAISKVRLTFDAPMATGRMKLPRFRKGSLRRYLRHQRSYVRHSTRRSFRRLGESLKFEFYRQRSSFRRFFSKLRRKHGKHHHSH